MTNISERLELLPIMLVINNLNVSIFTKAEDRLKHDRYISTYICVHNNIFEHAASSCTLIVLLSFLKDLSHQTPTPSTQENEHSSPKLNKMVLYENIDQILPNKLHGPMYYNICVYNGHVFYTLF